MDSVINGKDVSEKPSLPACAKNLLKTPPVAEFNAVSLNAPITPALNREVDAAPASRLAASLEALGREDSGDGRVQVESGREDSGDCCSTPKRGIFNSFDCESDDEGGDGCHTPRGSVFDAFAPCKICPPTPGPVIPQRIRLW